MENQSAETGFVCLACGGKELCLGYMGGTSSIFVPNGMFTINGFRTRTYVCLKCGHVGQYMSKERLEKLRETYYKRFSGKPSPD